MDCVLLFLSLCLLLNSYFQFLLSTSHETFKNAIFILWKDVFGDDLASDNLRDVVGSRGEQAIESTPSIVGIGGGSSIHRRRALESQDRC